LLPCDEQSQNPRHRRGRYGVSCIPQPSPQSFLVLSPQAQIPPAGPACSAGPSAPASGPFSAAFPPLDSRSLPLLALAPFYKSSHFSLYLVIVSFNLAFSSSSLRARASLFRRMSSSSAIRCAMASSDPPPPPRSVIPSNPLPLFFPREFSGESRGVVSW